MKRINKNAVDKRSRHAFSLLEIVGACAVLAIASGMCIIGFGKNFKASQEQEIVTTIEKNAHFAKTLANTVHSEVRLIFSKKDEQWEMSIAPDFTASAHLRKHAGSAKKLPGVRSVSSKPVLFQQNNSHVALSFFPSQTTEFAQVLEITFTSGTTKQISFKNKSNTEQTIHDSYPEEVLKKEKERFYTD